MKYIAHGSNFQESKMIVKLTYFGAAFETEYEVSVEKQVET